MDEDRDGCRHSFQRLVEPMIENTSSIGEAALSVNKNLWSIKDYWDIHFKPNQSPEILSPTQVQQPLNIFCLLHATIKLLHRAQLQQLIIYLQMQKLY